MAISSPGEHLVEFFVAARLISDSSSPLPHGNISPAAATLTWEGYVVKRVYGIAMAISCLIAATPAFAADESSRQIAARTELYQIRTLNLSDRQFLTADAGGEPVTTSAQLRIAQGTGRLPVVVLQHGSAGYSANVDVWSRELNELGISTFVLDGMTGRGLVEVNSNQALLGRLNFILDIYRALDVLAKHPRVDPERIVLMGFSRGGQAALYASLKRFHQMWNKSGVTFAAYIPTRTARPPSSPRSTTTIR
jgi:predicted alpha/beta-fold hydrolase